MRLAVFSDIHGNLTAFEAALADLEALGGADRIWVLGDLAAFGPQPAECIRRVRALKDAAEADETRKGTVCLVRGNTDRYLRTGAFVGGKAAEDATELAALIANMRATYDRLMWSLKQLAFEDYEFLKQLGEECDLYVDGFGGVIGYHGTPGNDEGQLNPETSDEEAADALLDREGRLGIGGHIHVQMDRVLERAGWRVVNVGSVGLSFDRPGKAQWGMFAFADGTVTVDLRAVPYDVDAALEAARAAGHPSPDWLANLLRR